MLRRGAYVYVNQSHARYLSKRWHPYMGFRGCEHIGHTTDVVYQIDMLLNKLLTNWIVKKIALFKKFLL